jgi:hypothetical protein
MVKEIILKEIGKVKSENGRFFIELDEKYKSGGSVSKML